MSLLAGFYLLLPLAHEERHEVDGPCWYVVHEELHESEEGLVLCHGEAVVPHGLLTGVLETVRLAVLGVLLPGDGALGRGHEVVHHRLVVAVTNLVLVPT